MTRLLLALVLTFLAACGANSAPPALDGGLADADTTVSDNEAARQLCGQYCARVAATPNCDPAQKAQTITDCRAGCRDNLGGLSSTCAAVAEVWYQCLSEATYACEKTQGHPFLSPPAQCEEQREDLVACIQGD